MTESGCTGGITKGFILQGWELPAAGGCYYVGCWRLELPEDIHWRT